MRMGFLAATVEDGQRGEVLSPHVNNQIPDFYLLPTSEINRILEVTRKGFVGAVASFGQQNDKGGPNCAYKLLIIQYGPIAQLVRAADS